MKTLQSWFNMNQIFSLLLMGLVILIVVFGVRNYASTHEQLSEENIQATIERYVVACYATEGAYPPDLEYLSKRYGLILDHERYFYDYEAFASNIRPMIIVVKR